MTTNLLASTESESEIAKYIIERDVYSFVKGRYSFTFIIYYYVYS